MTKKNEKRGLINGLLVELSEYYDCDVSVLLYNQTPCSAVPVRSVSIIPWIRQQRRVASRA